MSQPSPSESGVYVDLRENVLQRVIRPSSNLVNTSLLCLSEFGIGTKAKSRHEKTFCCGIADMTTISVNASTGRASEPY
jgi:hypothetical protein